MSVYTYISVPHLWETCSICLSQVCFILFVKFESSENLDNASLRNQLFTCSGSEEQVELLGHISGESLTLPIQAVPDPTLMEHTEGLNLNSFFFTPYPVPDPFSICFCSLPYEDSLAVNKVDWCLTCS